MKMILGAIALFVAVPAAAQSAPAADPHAGHSMPMPGMDHSKHQQGNQDMQMDCCKEAKCKECCDEMKGKAKAASPSDQSHEGHTGH